ncbi:MAG: hypothetical protein UR23_C0049G0003 [Candidatus Roizmanbacteria bacterium GW2011_GWA2_32_13]|uniref:Methyltransferase domain-containing protein n=1 Tax=Candidatus Roizmanbacteria bacterium GW2011_GWA2_32_13 TaxID=1618475 RepID=A0A0F9Z3A9_9BACT|nr:MAG: hypothetical protein UR23_C0049G0003 [Candidatus Roizmanbacteria bacterium GW2011_GWA2_32_13]
MEYLEHQNIGVEKIKINELLKKLDSVDFDLHQETADKAQLNPQERLTSIQNVWNIAKKRLNNPKTALDVGSGFAYGAVFLNMNNIKTVGIENVHTKNSQAQELFRKLGVTLNEVNEVDFSKSPAILETDFNKMEANEVTDLITMFYLSGELVINPQTFQVCEKLLKKDGCIVLSTEADRATIEKIINDGHFQLPSCFSIEIIDVPNNFEKTIIILKKV